MTVQDERKLLTPRFNQFYSDLLGFLRYIKFYSDFGHLFSFTWIYSPRFTQDHTAACTDCPIGLLCPHTMPWPSGRLSLSPALLSQQPHCLQNKVHCVLVLIGQVCPGVNWKVLDMIRILSQVCKSRMPGVVLARHLSDLRASSPSTEQTHPC